MNWKTWTMVALLWSFFLLLEAREWRYQRGSMDWPTSKGKILHSEVFKGQTSSKSGSSRTFTEYSPNLSYSYTVSGKRYEGRVFSFDSSWGRASTPGMAEDVVNKYPVGRKVKVFYDPNNPAVAVLQPVKSTGPVSTGGSIGTGGLVILTAICLALWKKAFQCYIAEN